ncbi:MAG: metallophosphoesterase [Candidatus Muirbacterium halophilum]|nr:metallophosphoesterase [Candidatus Muirbacterium halophilum]
MRKNTIIFLTIMVFLPFIYNLALTQKYYTIANISGFIGFSWMGFSFLFLTIGIIPFIISKIYKKTAKKLFYITLLICITLVFIGFFKACNIKLREITIESEKLPKDFSIKIAHITDTHFDYIKPYDISDNIIKILCNNKIDIILLTGDIIDGIAKNEIDISKKLNKLDYKYKLAVTGNHEFYHDLENSLEFIKKSGFKTLHGNTEYIDKYITISGVDDETLNRKKDKYSIIKQEKLIIDRITNETFNILMKHQPFLSEITDKKIDLQLSGHTHNGQIFPFNFATKLVYKYTNGMYFTPENNRIFVSSGTGFWGPPFRVFTESQIIIFTIKSSE